MKTSIRFAVAIIVPALSAPAGAQTSTVRFTLRFSLDDLKVERQVQPDQNVLLRVRLHGTDDTEDPGLPILPSVLRSVALPGGAQVERISVTAGPDATIEAPGIVAWGQLPRPGRDRDPIFPFGPDGEPDFTFYAGPDGTPIDPIVLQSPAWPPEVAKVVGTREIAGYQVVTLKISPVQWSGRAETFTLHTSLTVGVFYGGGKMPDRRDYGQAMGAEEVSATVVNSDDVVVAAVPHLPEDLDAWYLIVTDNFFWSSDMKKGASTGDMVSEFQRLADWKTEKGVTAAVVTVSDIIDGRYGSFQTGARDLQEVLRNFLKHAAREWHTAWVLLGGDVEVIPARAVVLNRPNGSHYLTRGEDAKPGKNGCYWNAATKTVRIHQGFSLGDIEADTKIACVKTGRAFGRVTSPSETNPGWAYVTSDAYSTETASKKEFIVLRGPAADTELTDFYAIFYWNTIPTDFYYSSILGPDYDKPGIHDWDKNDNGYYGQNDGTSSIDGVHFLPSVAVGRAPVASAISAQGFVNKVLAYEKYDGIPASFGRKLLLASTDWNRGPAVKPTTTNPPEVTKYYSAAGATTARLHFDGTADPVSNRLIAWDGLGDWWIVPCNPNANANSLGYFFCTDDAYSTRSHYVFEFYGLQFDFNLPTSYVKVLGPSDQIHPASFFFDSIAPDQSVTEKEQVKDQFAADFPSLDLRKRLYQDYLDTPGYPDPDLSELTVDALKAELNSGYNLVSLSGHGNKGGCCGVNTDWVALLTNGFAGGVVYADSCLTAAFDYGDSAGEVFLTTSSGGAVGYVGNSRFSWVGGGAPMERAFWHHLKYDRHLGRLHNTRIMFMDSPSHTWAIFSLNLLGDPEMHVRTGSPIRYRATLASAITVGSGFKVRVLTDQGESSIGVSKARVCVTGPRRLFRLYETTVDPKAGGEVEFPPLPTRAGDELMVTVVPAGPSTPLIPYQTTVRVLSAILLGDTNLDGNRDIGDVVNLLGFLFLGTGKVPCRDAADANRDGQPDISDALKILFFLFLGDSLAQVSPDCS